MLLLLLSDRLSDNWRPCNNRLSNDWRLGNNRSGSHDRNSSNHGNCSDRGGGDGWSGNNGLRSNHRRLGDHRLCGNNWSSNNWSSNNWRLSDDGGGSSTGIGGSRSVSDNTDLDVSAGVLLSNWSVASLGKMDLDGAEESADKGNNQGAPTVHFRPIGFS